MLRILALILAVAVAQGFFQGTMAPTETAEAGSLYFGNGKVKKDMV